MDRRKRGAAQKQIARCIIEHKRDHNGNSPTWEELADLMGYRHRMTAYNIVINVVSRNRLPKRPFMLDLGEPYGKVWLDIDDHGRPMVNPGEFVVEPSQPPLFDDREFSAMLRA